MAFVLCWVRGSLGRAVWAIMAPPLLVGKDLGRGCGTLLWGVPERCQLNPVSHSGRTAYGAGGELFRLRTTRPWWRQT